MFCRICGYELPENAQFCSRCGTNIAEEQNAATPVDTPPAPAKRSGKSIAGFVLSLCGIFMLMVDEIVLLIPCGVLGLIFSILGKKEISSKNLGGKGLATAGLVISIIVLGIIALVFLTSLLLAMSWIFSVGRLA